MGNASRVVGRSFEDRIENGLTAAKQTGSVIWYQHQQPSFTRFGVPLAASGADFAIIFRGGVAGAIEVKSVKGKRLMRDAVTADQAAHLNAATASWIAVEFRDEIWNHQFLVPWRLVPWEIARTAESVTLDALNAAAGKWKLASVGMLKDLVRECGACGAYWPTAGAIAPGCCFGAAPF